MGNEAELSWEVDWNPIRALVKRVLDGGEPLDLNDETRALLRRSAQEVGISLEDATDALRAVSTATTLLREVWQRIDDGGARLSKADYRAYKLRDAGDFAGARKLMQDVLAVEVVPLYREQSEAMLEDIATVEAVFLTGHVDPDFHAWSQVRALALRVQRGMPLELREDLRDFLRRTAPSVAIGEAEAEEALQSVKSVEALLGKMMERILSGKRRIMNALSRLMDCREAGDREGALKAMRDVLAEEPVPLYRKMAQEQIDRYDDPPPELPPHEDGK